MDNVKEIFYREITPSILEDLRAFISEYLYYGLKAESPDNSLLLEKNIEAIKSKVLDVLRVGEDEGINILDDEVCLLDEEEIGQSDVRYRLDKIAENVSKELGISKEEAY